MPRVKQSPKKNPRDLPNPTNWASILWNNHRKYFYLNFAVRCGEMVIYCGLTDVFGDGTNISR